MANESNVHIDNDKLVDVFAKFSIVLSKKLIFVETKNLIIYLYYNNN